MWLQEQTPATAEVKYSINPSATQQEAIAGFPFITSSLYGFIRTDEIYVEEIEHPVLHKKLSLDVSSPFADAGTDEEDLGVNMEDLGAAFMEDRSCDSIPTEVIMVEEVDLPFQLYPNPAGAEFFITIDFPGQFSYSIYDLTGSKLQSGNCSGQDTRIDTRYIPAGMFVIRLLSSDAGGSRILVIR